MRIIHTSDTHSCFLNLPKEGEIIIHSGDLLPNITRGSRKIEEKFQHEWVISNIEKFKLWLDGRPFVFCQGNHDFIDPCEILNRFNIEAYNITNSFLSLKEIKLYGFPYVPYICGEWNNEKHLPEMKEEISCLIDRLEKFKPNILVTHCPPHGILDQMYNLDYVGNSLLSNAISYNLLPETINHILCGHIHEAHGIINQAGLIISQAATTVHLLDLKNEKI